MLYQLTTVKCVPELCYTFGPFTPECCCFDCNRANGVVGSHRHHNKVEGHCYHMIACECGATVRGYMAHWSPSYLYHPKEKERKYLKLQMIHVANDNFLVIDHVHLLVATVVLSEPFI
jgi:hypothetical protein